VRAEDGARVVLTPIATPLPLTFVGLLIASTMLSALELGWIPAAQSHQAGWVLLAVPIPLQLLAAYFGFQGRSASAATGSSTLAAAWLGIALDLITAPAGSFNPSSSTGMLALGVAAALLIPALSDAWGGSVLPAATLAFASSRFVLTGITGLTHSVGLKHATGVVGLCVAAVALYAALALELEGSRGAELLPTFRRSQSRSALVAPLAEQVVGLENEAGVRRNL
jgi:succinate-acetate transporter protein